MKNLTTIIVITICVITALGFKNHSISQSKDNLRHLKSVEIKYPIIGFSTGFNSYLNHKTILRSMEFKIIYGNDFWYVTKRNGVTKPIRRSKIMGWGVFSYFKGDVNLTRKDSDYLDTANLFHYGWDKISQQSSYEKFEIGYSINFALFLIENFSTYINAGMGFSYQYYKLPVYVLGAHKFGWTFPSVGIGIQYSFYKSFGFFIEDILKFDWLSEFPLFLTGVGGYGGRSSEAHGFIDVLHMNNYIGFGFYFKMGVSRTWQ